MRVDSFTDSERRNLAVGVLLVLVSALLVGLITPIWVTNAGYNVRVEEAQLRLQKLERLAAQGNDLRARFNELSRDRLRRGYVLNSQSEAKAAAELQRIVKAITADNGTQLMSTQILPASEDEDFAKISLRIRITGPLPGLIEGIYDLEAESVLMFLENLTLSESSSRRLRTRAAIRQFEASYDLIAYTAVTE